ncbi:unnamed protein product [Calicophoron daubneyi]|uniref:Sugar phosphate exchanger 3 n=1 Tax=Calicophoron daubneyi TaxID=300641 RepID=A0AAV2TJF1_CALDB
MTRCFRAAVDRFLVFSFTFAGYALLHANRKAFGNLKQAIANAWVPPVLNQSSNLSSVLKDNATSWERSAFFDTEEAAAVFLGVLDSIFMVSYAFGLYVSGCLGDNVQRRLAMFFGLSGSAVIIFLFGCVIEWTKFYDRYLYSFLWIINGLLQSTVWPSAVAAMNERFGNFRGFILGLWCSCASVGNIMGDLIIGAVVPYGYEYGFLILSSVMFVFSFLLLFGLSERQEVGKPEYHLIGSEYADGSLTDTPGDSKVSVPTVTTSNGRLKRRNEQFSRILCMPEVVWCSLAYACMKLVNYALFFWLTFYLTNNFHWSSSNASNFSAWFDMGGIIGGIVVGLVSDIFAKRISRHSMSLLLCVATVPALLGYRYTPASPSWVNGLVMSSVGFLVGGPAVLISAVLVGDISEYSELRGSRTQATVAGIIDGTGSVGAAGGQVLVPLFAYRFGWSSVFFLFVGCMTLTSICLIPVWFRLHKFVPKSEDREQLLSPESDR